MHDIFSYSPALFKMLEELNVLVIGAGTFPSFIPLLESLSASCSSIRVLNISLIEPNKIATDEFKKAFSIINKNEFNFVIKYSVHNTDIRSYLKNLSGAVFDLIYFEHPDYSIFNSLLSKLKLARNDLSLSMQSSIPYLANVINDFSMIIASCIFKYDAHQIKSLLEFSLRFKMKLIQQSKINFGGRYYSFGLIGVMDKRKLSNKPPEKSE